MIYFNYPCTWSHMSHNFNFTRSNCENLYLEEQKLIPDKFSISYPVIKNVKDKESIKKINDSITTCVSKLFKDQVLIPAVVNFTDVIGNYETMVNKNQVLSILFNMATYVYKAAHGFTKYSAITVNTTTGHIYTFNELFNPKINYVEIINNLAKEYIEENNIQLINEYKGVVDNQEYYLTDNSLVLFYQIYEYTPYYYGIFKISIPYEKIENIIGPMSPINKLIKK